MKVHSSAIFHFASSLLLAAQWPQSAMALNPRVEQVYSVRATYDPPLPSLGALDECSIYFDGTDPRGSYMGGGFVTSTHFFIVFGAEYDYSVLVGAPITRDASSGKITNIDFANCFDASTNIADFYYYAYLGFKENGPNGDRFYSYYDYGIGIGNLDGSNQLIEQQFLDNSDVSGMLTSGGDDYSNYYFPFGIDWHPTITDNSLGHNQMYATGYQGFGRMTWSYDGGSGQYTPLTLELLADLDVNLAIDYPGGLLFIPSGSQAGSVITNDWDNSRVLILQLSENGLCFDAGTGAETSYTENPQFEILVDGIVQPYGMILDPETNDFFIATWGNDGAEIELVHFSVFAPGVNVQLVVDNISARVEEITLLANIGGRRRELGKKKKLTLQDLIDAWLEWYYARNPPTTPPSPADITDNVNTAIESGDSGAVVEALVGPLETISSNSLTEAVSGGDFTEFTAEIESTEGAVLESVDALGELVPAANMAQFEAAKAAIENSFALLKGIADIEG